MFLMPFIASAQHDSTHWQYLTANDKKVIGYQFFDGAFDGLNNALQHHGIGAGYDFWDYQTSWKRKYKYYDGGDLRARYLFSKSLLVAGTDGWHATRAASRITKTFTIIIDDTNFKSWRKILRKALIVSIANRAGFYLTYNLIFKK
jgi:hypothetical protein